MLGMIVLTSTPAATSSALDPTTLLAWLTCLTIVGGMVIGVWKYGRKIMQMVEDFNGTAERPGVPARPGVMARMSSMEIRDAARDTQLEVIHAEVNYNHGGSIKDAVDRMDKRLEGVDADVRVLKDQNVEKLARLGQIETTISNLHGQYVDRMEGVDSAIKGLHEKTNISVDITRTSEAP